jgi:hypothetical protein
MEINVNKGIIFFSYVNPTTDKTLSYRYDINKGTFENLKGREIKTITAKKACLKELGSAIGEINYWGDIIKYHSTTSLTLATFFKGQKENFCQFKECVQMANKLDNLGLPNLIEKMGSQAYYLHSLSDKHIKAFVQWYKALPQNDSIAYISSFLDYYSELELMKEYPFLKGFTDRKELEYIKALLYSNNFKQASKIEQDTMIYYYITRGMYKIPIYEEKIFGNYRSNRELSTILEYITICRAMGKTPQKEKDFYREYKDTLTTYYFTKEEYDIKTMYKNYEKQRKAFTFSYGDYEIIVPQTPQDIVREGAEMHHCVGTYVNKVVQNETYIVFVRHKANLTAPYITAQVKLNGELGQYFLAYDRYISSVEDQEFKDAFQEHLKTNWVIE